MPTELYRPVVADFSTCKFIQHDHIMHVQSLGSAQNTEDMDNVTDVNLKRL